MIKKEILVFLAFGLHAVSAFKVCGQNGAVVIAAEDYYLKGKECLLKGDYSQANEFFKRAESLLDQDTSGQAPVFNKELSPRDKYPVSFESAVAAPAEDLDEKSVSGIARRASEAYSKGQLEVAAALLRQAVELAPRNGDLRYNLGVVYLKQKDYRQAINSFKRAVALNRRDSEAYYNLGVIYETVVEDQKQAIYNYSRYLKFAPPGKGVKMVRKWLDSLTKVGIK